MLAAALDPEQVVLMLYTVLEEWEEVEIKAAQE
jgi:hypothetical protein